MENQSTYYSSALQCAEQVCLPLKNHVWNGQTGDFLGKGTGSSMDFQDQRNYVPGDDPRHLNWQAYARTGTFTMKQYREEVRPTVELILDVSSSMFFDEQKERRSSELLYLIYTSAIKNGADLFCHLISGKEYIPLSSDRIASQQWKSMIPSSSEKIYQEAPELQLINFRPASIRVFISDLLFEGDPAPLLHPLTAKQGKPILLIPYLTAESNPTWSGNYDFIDAERGTKHIHKIDPHTLKLYLSQYSKHFKLWIQSLQKHHIPFGRVCANHGLFDSLLNEAIPNQALQLSQT